MKKATLGRMAERTFDAIAGNGVVAALSRNRSRDHLRILAYHGVDDAECFRVQMEHLRRHYVPVSADQVLGSVGGSRLPRLAVWVTFDDGHPSVLEQGLPITERFGIPITLFVCPAVIDTNDPLWWQAIARVHQRDDASGPDADAIVRKLKLQTDMERRETVQRLMETTTALGNESPTQRQLTSESLRLLNGTGATIGNHTWDHPTLDTCEPIDQDYQIRRAHGFLQENTQFRPVFAYPNGNWTREAEAVAEDLGYRLGLLFDHRLTNTSAPPFRWSRLRVSSDTPIRRFAAILSGTHPRFHRRREAMRALARTLTRNRGPLRA